MSQTETVARPSPDEPSSLTGREIAGRYRIGAKLGEGGMGAVYKAEQISLKRTVAIKLLRPEVSSNAMLLRRFNAEAEAVAKLRHPNTVSIYDFGQDTDGTLFIAMEYIEGRSLRSLIHHEAPLPPRRALAIASQVAASLSDAHARTIIHRDLKPDNVMLTDRGRAKDCVTVLDFGIAKLRDDQRGTQAQMTQAGDMLGTPQYMAPEQIRAEAIDGRTDIYALGCMLYEMLTARLPFEGPTIMALLSKHLVEQAPPPSQRRPELGLSPAIDELVRAAMAKDPAARPATMDEYGERIAALLASLPGDGTAQRSAVVGIPASPPPGAGPSAGPHAAADTPAAPSALGAFAQLTPAPYAPSQAPPAYAAPAVPPPSSPPPAAYPMPPSSPPAAYAAQYPGAYAGPPSPPPYAPSPSPAAGSSKLMWALVAVLLVGAGGGGVYFATRGKGATAPRDAAIVADPDPSEPDDDPPPVRERTPDPWSGVRGTTVDVAQGVRLVLPPGMRWERDARGNIVAGDLQRLAVIAGPIVERSSDPDALAASYARETGLQQVSSEEYMIAGAKRRMYGFGGMLNGVRVAHVAVPLIGPGYRVAIVVHMVVPDGELDTALQATATDILVRRILVPGAPGASP